MITVILLNLVMRRIMIRMSTLLLISVMMTMQLMKFVILIAGQIATGMVELSWWINGSRYGWMKGMCARRCARWQAIVNK
jgi:hypothetical protein